ncbi:hypothetical protein B0H13DRAFT_2082702 [Mycena leptocephala]|nr:hypothetical protein B0H13DRAFT_2082702 [Mycena leptocephala]
MCAKILFISWVVPLTTVVASIRACTRTETRRSDNFSRRKSGCIMAAARGFEGGAEKELFTLEAITNASDSTCVKGIQYTVADAIQVGWNQMGTQAKGFFVALLFGPHPGKQKGNKETLCLGPHLVPPHLDCICNCVLYAFDTCRIRCVGLCPQIATLEPPKCYKTPLFSRH